jgi:hypothetical protein
MRSYKTRLEHLEKVTQSPTSTKYVVALMDFDDTGQCSSLELEGRTFTPHPGESEDELCRRAKQETGCADCSLIIWQGIKPGPTGGFAPGFERFGKK